MDKVILLAVSYSRLGKRTSYSIQVSSQTDIQLFFQRTRFKNLQHAGGALLGRVWSRSGSVLQDGSLKQCHETEQR